LGFDPSALRPIRRILILWPPHLLKSWRDQAAAVLPGHRVQTVETVSDLELPAEIYLLSRETAKLSHGLRRLEPRSREARQCPRYGHLVTGSFPPFRGGLCRWADQEGLARIIATFERFEGSVGDRYAPLDARRQTAAAGGFYARGGGC
jgi:hypothetical protein